ncbi:MAG: hypothetical protein HQM08_09765 [Candidatus Riflebacteria bacterium]|nr:hypothetical protein [Candidatus Riflebacteria bacterium]
MTQILFGGSNGAFQLSGNSLFPYKKNEIDLGWIQAFERTASSRLIGSSKGLWVSNKVKTEVYIADVWITAVALTDKDRSCVATILSQG